MSVDYSLVKKWYGQSIPKTFRDFMGWQINSKVIAKKVYPNIDVRLTNKNHAYTTPNIVNDSYKIHIPIALFTKEFFDGFDVLPDDMIYAGVAMYNGFMLHEATHVKIFDSEKTRFMSVADQIDAFISDHSIRVENNFSMCRNLVEDLFVWEYDKKYYSHINPFMQITLDIIANYKLLEIQKVEDQNILTTLFEWRNEKNRNYPVFEQLSKFVDILKWVNLDTRFFDRLFLAKELYDLLPKNKNEQQIHQTGDDGRSLIQNISNELDINKAVKAIAEEAVKIEKEIKTKEEEIKTDDRFNPDKIKTLYKYIGDVTSTDPRNYKLDLTANNKWQALIKVLKVKSQEKHKLSIPQKTGFEVMLDQLPRVHTDQKVFGNRNSFKRLKRKPEVVILLDFSGSMRHDVVKVSEEAYQLIKLLEQQRFNVSLFVHSTKKPDCVVYGLYSNVIDLSKHGNKLSLSQALTLAVKNISLQENVDGLAIDYVSKQFTSINSEKVLFVMSDGKPTSDYYRGEKAIQHTTSIVNDIRKKGVKIISVSLTKAVQETNERIYGRKYNIVADKLENQMQTIANILQ